MSRLDSHRHKAKPLSRADVDVLCEELRLKDVGYAQNLDTTQSNFLKTNPRIKNWKDFETVENMKRVMIGLHDRSEIVIIDEDEIAERERETAKRMKKIRNNDNHF